MCKLYFGEIPNLSLICYCMICCSVVVESYEGFSVIVLPRTLLISKKSQIVSEELGKECE